nr:transposase, mutator type [Ipomoea batatas]
MAAATLHLPTILAPLPRPMTGRPKKKRTSEPNEHPIGKISRQCRLMTCSICKQKGHSKKICPTKSFMPAAASTFVAALGGGSASTFRTTKQRKRSAISSQSYTASAFPIPDQNDTIFRDRDERSREVAAMAPGGGDDGPRGPPADNNFAPLRRCLGGGFLLYRHGSLVAWVLILEESRVSSRRLAGERAGVLKLDGALSIGRLQSCLKQMKAFRATTKHGNKARQLRIGEGRYDAVEPDKFAAVKAGRGGGAAM